MWSIETMYTLYGVPYNEWFVNQKYALDAFVDDSSTSYDLMCTWFLLHMFCHNISAQMNRNSVPRYRMSRS